MSLVVKGLSNAIGLFLTLLGPRNLPASSHQMYQWSSNIWETAFLCKFLVNSPFPAVALLLVFRDISLNSQGRLFYVPLYFVQYSVDFVISNFSLSHPIYIRLFIRYIRFLLLLFEHSSLIICYFYSLSLL